MSDPKLRLPPIPESEQTPLVQELLRLLVEYQKRIAELEEEIKRLKGHPRKPKIHASRMDQEAGQDEVDKPRRARGPQLKNPRHSAADAANPNNPSDAICSTG